MLKRTRSNYKSVAMNIPSMLISKYCSHKREPSLLSETADSRTGEGKCKMSLEHLMSDSKEMLRE